MSDFEDEFGFTEADWQACLKVLTQLKEDPLANPENEIFAGLVGKIVKQAKKNRRKTSYQEKKRADWEIIKQSTITDNALKGVTTFSCGTPDSTPTFAPIQLPKNCYSCNQSYDRVHSFYARLCPECAELNYRNRFRSIDLQGRNVIITGGRVKIGYATALKFLRSNANVIITSRFPATALVQFENEPDYSEWKHRLTVYGLDLRSLPQVQMFIEYYHSHHNSIEVLINNAAQTISYDAEYYLPLINQERKLLVDRSVGPNLIANQIDVAADPALLSLPTDVESSTRAWTVNRFGQPVDQRSKTSWNSTLCEVDLTELLEANLINQLSPYVLIKEFTQLFEQSAFDKKFIINVTSSEGQFSYTNKTDFHPHTNMTKASLNMLTNTSAKEYLGYGVYMNAVDVGWVSTGANEMLRQQQFARGYIPPLDPVDGAARIMVPIIDELEESLGVVGKLLKNYRVQPW